jgi:hypothetical protein
MVNVFIKTNRNESSIQKNYMNILFNDTQSKGMLPHYHEIHPSGEGVEENPYLWRFRLGRGGADGAWPEQIESIEI